MESEKRVNINIRRKMVVVVGILFIITGYGIVYYITGLNNRYMTESTPMDTGWRVSYGDKHYMNVTLSTFKFDKPIAKGEAITLYNTIPQNWNYYIPILQIKTNNSAVSVFLNGKNIYEYGQDRYESSDYVGSGYNYVDLGDFSQGQSVKIIIIPTEDAAFSSFDQVFVTDYTNVSRQMLTQNRLPYMMGNFLLLFGIALIGAGFAISIISVQLLRILWIGTLSVCIGIWTLSYYGLLQMYGIPIYYCTLLEYIAFYISPIPVLLYFRQHIKDTCNRAMIRGYKILLAMQSVLFTGMLIVNIWKIVHPVEVVSVLRLVMIITAVYIAAFMVMRLRKNYRLGGLEFVGFFIMGIFIMADVIGYQLQKYAGVHLIKVSGLSAFGAFIFVILTLIAFGIEISIKLKMTTEKEVLYRMAYSDVMTDVSNRRRCEEELENLSGTTEWFGIFNFDLNNLKGTNDTLGHVYGDELIHGFAQILKATFQNIGIIGRMGGDEFVVIVRGMKKFQIEPYISQLQQRMDEENKKDEKLHYSVAYGYAESTEIADEEGVIADARMVYELADHRMYENKKKSTSRG